MAQAARQPARAPDQDDDLFWLTLEDDTEEAPWMVMGDAQFWTVNQFADSLRAYAQNEKPNWYVAGMLPILYRLPGEQHTRQLAPDTFVAFVPRHDRSSFDTQTEPGGFPPFVLEVVSPSSREHDEKEKREAYRRLGVQEYAIFDPEAATAPLSGYRRSVDGRFIAWKPDRAGRLVSALLGLYLVVRGRRVRAQLPDGQLLPILDDALAAQRRAEAAARQAEAEARQAEAGHQAEAEARRQAEAELVRLRQELARQQRPLSE